jgi:hypothetical protein
MLGYLEGRNNSCTVICGRRFTVRSFGTCGRGFLGKGSLTSTAGGAIAVSFASSICGPIVVVTRNMIAATMTSGHPVPVPTTPRAASNTARLPSTSFRCARAGEELLTSGRQCDWHILSCRSERQAAAIPQTGISRCRAGRRFIEPDMKISRIRLSDKTSRLHPRHVVPKPAQFGKSKGYDCRLRNAQGRDGSSLNRNTPTSARGEHARRTARARARRAIR